MSEIVDKSGTVKSAHKGFDRAWDALHLQFQMWARIIGFVLITQGLITATLCFIAINESQRSVTVAYYRAKLSRTMFSNPTIDFTVNDKDFSLPASQITRNPEIGRVARGQVWKYMLIWLLSCPVYLLIPVIVRHFKRKTEKEMAVEHIRGPQLLTSAQLISEIQAEENRRAEEAKAIGAPTPLAPRFQIGGIPLPVRFETHNLGIFGKPGMGKSVTSYQIQEKMRGHKAVVLDVAGEYISKFYSPERGDKIFNILDERGVRWNIFNEFKTKLDVEAFWQSLVPDVKGGGNEQFFNDAARAVGIGATHVCIARGTKTPEALAELIFSNTEIMEKALNSCKAAARGHVFIQQPNGNLAGSVVAVLMQYAGWLELLPAGEGDWGLTDWLNDPSEGFLFLSTKKDVAKILQPALSLFVDLAARRLLSQPDDRDRRIFFLLDEFGALNRMNMFHSLLTEGRKKGVVIILIIQDISQIKEKYGEDVTRTILNSIGSIVTFNLSDDFTAQSLEKRFGQTEYWETKESHVLGVDTKASITQSKDKRLEALILTSEIQSLKEFEFYIRIPNFNPCRGKLSFLPVNNTPVNHPDFVLRPGFELDSIIEEPVVADPAQAPVTTPMIPAFKDPFAAVTSATPPAASFDDEPEDEGKGLVAGIAQRKAATAEILEKVEELETKQAKEDPAIKTITTAMEVEPPGW